MCNIKTDWGIVVQQDGTANIFIVPLRRTERKITRLKLHEAEEEKNTAERFFCEELVSDLSVRWWKRKKIS